MFHVSAGTFDGDERNCKYCDSFDSLDKAIVAYNSYVLYPWCELAYKGKDNTYWVMNPYPQPTNHSVGY